MRNYKIKNNLRTGYLDRLLYLTLSLIERYRFNMTISCKTRWHSSNIYLSLLKQQFFSLLIRMSVSNFEDIYNLDIITTHKQILAICLYLKINASFDTEFGALISFHTVCISAFIHPPVVLMLPEKNSVKYKISFFKRV